MLPKVLVVEDNGDFFRHFQEDLEGICELVMFTEQEESLAFFNAHKGELAVIAVGACTPGDTPNTQGLIRAFRSEFSGPIIAMSTLDEYARSLLPHGASHCVSTIELPKVLVEILQGLEEKPTEGESSARKKMDEGDILSCLLKMEHHVDENKADLILFAVPRPELGGALRYRFRIIREEIGQVISRIERIREAAEQGDCQAVLAVLDETFEFGHDA